MRRHAELADLHQPIVVLSVRGWSRITRRAMRFAIQLSSEVYALHIAGDEIAIARFGGRVERCSWSRPCISAGVPKPKLVVIPFALSPALRPADGVSATSRSRIPTAIL